MLCCSVKLLPEPLAESSKGKMSRAARHVKHCYPGLVSHGAQLQAEGQCLSLEMAPEAKAGARKRESEETSVGKKRSSCRP